MIQSPREDHADEGELFLLIFPFYGWTACCKIHNRLNTCSKCKRLVSLESSPFAGMSFPQVTYLSKILFFLCLTWYTVCCRGVLLALCMTEKTWGNVSLPMQNHSLITLRALVQQRFIYLKIQTFLQKATFSLQWI